MRKWNRIILYSVFVLLTGQSLGQPDLSKDQEDAVSVLESDDQSWMGLFDLSRYAFRDLTLYWDNDGTVPNFIDDTDRYYTNSNGIELSFDPRLSPALASRLAISEEGEQRFGVGISLKQRIYTPTNILLVNPPARDHPYGGHLALEFAFQRADAKKHDHFALSLGITGHTSGAETIQGWIHNTFPDEDDPLGWNTQLPTEATLNFSYMRTWKSKPADIGGLELEMLPSLGFDVGTALIDARSSMTLRVGKHLPDDFGPASLLKHRDHTIRTSDASESNWSIYGYATLGVDAIAHDIFLDGTVFSSSRSAMREPLVATFTFGLIVQYESFYIGWSQSLQSERFELQPDRQTYGSLVLGCSFDW